MNCEQVAANIEIYALGAMSAKEMREIELHLNTCPDCRALLERYNRTLESLSLEAASFSEVFEPSEGHRERFIAKLESRPQLRPGSKSSQELAEEAAATRPYTRVPSPTVATAKIRAVRHWRNWFGVMAFGLSLVALVAVGAWAFYLQGQLDAQNRTSAAQLKQSQADLEAARRDKDQQAQKSQADIATLKQQNEQLAQQNQGLSQTAQQAQTRADTLQRTSLLLAQKDATTRVAGSNSLNLTVVMAPDEKAVAVVFDGLPALQPGQVYYLWLHKENQPYIAGGALNLITLNERTHEAFLTTPDPMKEYQAISITIEQASTSPTAPGPEIIRDQL